jgi:hypothetical protein
MNRTHAFYVPALALAALAGSSSAQSLVGFDGAAIALEQNGGPAGACAYPTGPFVGAFATAVASPCPVPGAAAFPLGDVAVDRMTNVTWITDGMVVAGYAPGGAPLTGFLVPPGFIAPFFGPLTGLGADAPAGLLWVTDGAFAAAIAPGPCGGFPAVVVPPFPLPPVGAPYTDIDWDSSTGTLFGCTLGGLIVNSFVGGAVGPFGVYPPVACPLGPLTGIAWDAGAPPGAGITFVTDGVLIGHILPGGPPAPPSFAFAPPCFPTAAPYVGLAYTARGTLFGAGFDPLGAIPPVIGSVGQSISPNPAFAVTLAGAPPGNLALLYVSTGALCPALAIPFPVYLALVPPPTLLAVGPVPPTGAITAPVPIPPGMPLGVSVDFEWFTVYLLPGTPVSTTSGLEAEFAMP